MTANKPKMDEADQSAVAIIQQLLRSEEAALGAVLLRMGGWSGRPSSESTPS